MIAFTKRKTKGNRLGKKELISKRTFTLIVVDVKNQIHFML